MKSRIMEWINYTRSIFVLSFHRPLLIILDRSVDMATPFHHTWTYQALAHDVLDLARNRLVVEENIGSSPAGGARSKTKVCELNNMDRFWTQHKGCPFPRVAEAIQDELEQYRSHEQEVKRLKSSMVILFWSNQWLNESIKKKIRWKMCYQYIQAMFVIDFFLGYWGRRRWNSLCHGIEQCTTHQRSKIAPSTRRNEEAHWHAHHCCHWYFQVLNYWNWLPILI